MLDLFTDEIPQEKLPLDLFADEQSAEPVQKPTVDLFADEVTPTPAPGGLATEEKPDSFTYGGVGKSVKSLGRGIAETVITEVPDMIGSTAQFVGERASATPEIKNKALKTAFNVGATLAYPARQTAKLLGKAGKFLKESAQKENEIVFGKAPEIDETDYINQAVYQGSKMLGPSVMTSIIPGGGPTIAAILFGASQAQQTVDTANEKAVQLEEQGDIKGAEEMRGKAEGIAPILTGTIEAIGEHYGTKYLGKWLGVPEDEAIKIIKKTFGQRTLDFLKTLGVEVGTEVGQQFGEAGVEKITGIRPEAKPIEEGLEVIGPTLFMTALTGGLAAGASAIKPKPESVDILKNEEDKRKPGPPEAQEIVDAYDQGKITLDQVKQLSEPAEVPPATTPTEEAPITPKDKLTQDFLNTVRTELTAGRTSIEEIEGLKTQAPDLAGPIDQIINEHKAGQVAPVAAPAVVPEPAPEIPEPIVPTTPEAVIPQETIPEKAAKAIVAGPGPERAQLVSEILDLKAKQPATVTAPAPVPAVTAKAPPAPKPAKMPGIKQLLAKETLTKEEIDHLATRQGKVGPFNKKLEDTLKAVGAIKGEAPKPTPVTPEPTVKAKEPLKTLSGREVNPPSIRLDTNRKATIDSEKADIWLRDEAIKEAKTKNDEFNLLQFEGSNPKKLTTAEKEGMHQYLFGDVKNIFELKTPETTTKAPEAKAKEPWEMTYAEYLAEQSRGAYHNLGAGKSIDEFGGVRALHKMNVEAAIKEGKLSPEDYNKLHAKDYGPIEKFAPDLTGKAKPAKPPKVSKGKAAIDKSKTPLEKISINRKAVHAETGETVNIKQDAKTALNEIEAQRTIYRNILDCVTA